jgi:hypothetical protein
MYLEDLGTCAAQSVQPGDALGARKKAPVQSQKDRFTKKVWGALDVLKRLPVEEIICFANVVGSNISLSNNVPPCPPPDDGLLRNTVPSQEARYGIQLLFCDSISFPALAAEVRSPCIGNR